MAFCWSSVAGVRVGQDVFAAVREWRFEVGVDGGLVRVPDPRAVVVKREVHGVETPAAALRAMVAGRSGKDNESQEL